MRSRTLEVNNLANHSSADRSLFRGLLMTACDLGAITKPWPIQKKVSQNCKKIHYDMYSTFRIYRHKEEIYKKSKILILNECK